MSFSASNNSNNEGSQHRGLLRQLLRDDGEGGRQHSTRRRGSSMPSKSECILEQLKASNSDIQELQLSSTQAAVLGCESLVQALQQNQTVHTVRIDGFFVDQLLSPFMGDPMTARQHQQQKKGLWQALGSLPKLQELHMNYFVESAVSVEALGWVLGRAFGLTRLFLHDCKMSLDNMAHLPSLKQHAALREVHITQLTLSSDETTTGKAISLDPLVPMLMSATNLHKLGLCMSQPQKHLLSNDSLSMIAANNIGSLKTLDLRNVILDNSSMAFLMRQLMATMEATDNNKKSNHRSGMRGLVLTTSQDGLNLDACLAIGSLLQHQNNRLELLDLRGTRIEELGLLAMANSLRTNRTLRELNLRYDNITPRGCDALIDVLRHNYYLETMVFRASLQDAVFLHMVDFYLTMNTTRIRRLLLNVNVDWGQIFDKLVVHVENVNYLFHLLRGNPSFLLASF